MNEEEIVAAVTGTLLNDPFYVGRRVRIDFMFGDAHGREAVIDERVSETQVNLKPRLGDPNMTWHVQYLLPL